MAHQQEILELISPWKRRFRPAEICIEEAVSSLRSSDPLIELKAGATNGRWQVYNHGTDNSAVLVHAGIWAWGSDIDTGNFVPAGEEAPKGLPESRIQNEASYRCEVTYAFDTSADESFYDHLKTLEEYVKTRPSFNKANRPRRAWQNGIGLGSRQKIMFTSKVFVKRTPYNTPQDCLYKVKYPVHPWIHQTVKSQSTKQHIPNPDRPRRFIYSNQTMTPLEDAEIPEFQRGDIIWMSFTIAFVIGGDSWWPEIIPMELVRVGKLPEHITSSTDAVLQTFDPGFEGFEPGSVITLIETPTRQGKRKEREDKGSEGEDGSRKRHERDESDEDHVMIDSDATLASEENSSANGGTWKLRSKTKDHAGGSKNKG